MGAVTVVGLVRGGLLLEDIRVTVPERVAIQIPAHLAERSRSLREALEQRRVMKLGSVPVATDTVSHLATALRGRGIAPVVSARQEPAAASSDDRELLVLELEASREECRRLRAKNDALQGTLEALAGQLVKIQQGVDTLLQRQPGLVAAPPLSWNEGQRSATAAVPHYIPATTLEVAEVRINPTESRSVSNVDAAVAALRSLRGKSA